MIFQIFSIFSTLVFYILIKNILGNLFINEKINQIFEIKMYSPLMSLFFTINVLFFYLRKYTFLNFLQIKKHFCSRYNIRVLRASLLLIKNHIYCSQNPNLYEIKYHTFEKFLIICHAWSGVHEAFVILISKLIVLQDLVGIDVIKHVRVKLFGNDDCQNGQNGQQAEIRSTHFIGVSRNLCCVKLNILFSWIHLL